MAEDPYAPERHTLNETTWEYDYTAPQRPYEIGDTVTWSLFGGQIVTEVVTEIDFKNNAPIFIGDKHWGYDTQIIRVEE